ncbi:hypothetical protein ACFC4I_11305 [Enterococcus durans]|uniref:hypothetical protein n=1 Tax=Enterococcus durans TaxID=53345 RepID=UPI0035DA44CB
MDREQYTTLRAVRERVEAKVNRNQLIKDKLRKAVREVNSIDDIYMLLDYKAKLTFDDWASRIERLYRLQYESLGVSYIPLERKQGRHAIFDKDKNDIVSKFRRSGIVKFRTITLNTVRVPENDSRKIIVTEVYKKWKEEMLNWISNQDDRLSNDEKKVSTIKYRLVDDSDDSTGSILAEEVLNDLNVGESFNIMKYENGEIDAAVYDILVVDFSE